MKNIRINTITAMLTICYATINSAYAVDVTTTNDISTGIYNNFNNDLTVDQVKGDAIISNMSGEAKINTLSDRAQIVNFSGNAQINKIADQAIIYWMSDNTIINEMVGGQIGQLDSATIHQMNGGFVRIMNDGHIDSVTKGQIGNLLGGSIDLVTGEAWINSMTNGYIANMSGGTVHNMDGGTINRFSEQARINSLNDGTINHMTSGFVEEMLGGTIEDMSGGQVGTLDGGLIKTVSENSWIENILSGNVDHLTGGFINNMNGGQVKHFTKGQIASFTDGEIDTMNNNAYINNMTGGVINKISENAYIGTMNGGVVHELDGGALGDVLGNSKATFTGNSDTKQGGAIIGNVASSTDLTLADNGFMIINLESGKVFDGTLKMQGGTVKVEHMEFGDNNQFGMQSGANNKLWISTEDVTGLNVQLTASVTGELQVDDGINASINRLSGDSSTILNKTGLGNVVIDTLANQLGHLSIKQGAVIVGSDLLSNGSLKSSIDVEQSAILGGYGTINGDVDNAGSLYVGSMANAYLTNTESNYYGRFTIEGDYIGHQGTVYFNTHLSDDSAPSDTLFVTGDAKGQSLVKLADSAAGMAGAQTTADGILLVNVAGESSSDAFKLSGRAVSGAYEYYLYQGGIDGNEANDDNWYLRSSNILLRPEVGGYLANISAANNMFTRNMQLDDRGYKDGQHSDNQFWFNAYTDNNKFNDSTGILSNRVSLYVFRIGNDFYTQQFGDDGLFKLGGMFAYGHSEGSTNSSSVNYNAKSQVNGYSIGGYATWFEHQNQRQGLYVDSWLQYGWFNNSISGEQLGHESYKSHGIMASIETGYTMNVLDNIYIQPQAQAIWTNIISRSFSESNGTVVDMSNNSKMNSRVAIKIFADVKNSLEQFYQPYIKLSWLHNSKEANVTLNGLTRDHLSASGSKNIGEIDTGIQVLANQNLSAWGNVFYQLGTDDYSNVGMQIGVKYSF